MIQSTQRPSPACWNLEVWCSAEWLARRRFQRMCDVNFLHGPLAYMDQATTTVLGNGALESLNISSIPPHTVFPFTTNEPKNPLESNSAPLFGAIYTALVNLGSGTSAILTR